MDLIRRCLDSLTPKQLLNVCATCFTLHKQRMRALRDMRDLRRWHVLRRSRCKWRVRSASAQLYILRTRMRGWVAVSDALVVVLIIALCCGFFYFTRALTIYIRRAETVEALSDAMQASIMLLEQHGGDGAKLLNATK